MVHVKVASFYALLSEFITGTQFELKLCCVPQCFRASLASRTDGASKEPTENCIAALKMGVSMRFRNSRVCRWMDGGRNQRKSLNFN